MAEDRLVVAALLRKGGQILLVPQHEFGEPQPTWALPCGAAEPDELLLESLQRVVRAETGLEIVRVGDLISLSQSHHASTSQALAKPGGRVMVFVFAVAEWKGELDQSGADTSTREARFWSRSEAIDRLERLPTRAMREPILAYLRDDNTDRVWLYRYENEGDDRLVWPTREPAPEVSEQMRRARAIVALGCIVILAILVIIVIIGIITLARPFI